MPGPRASLLHALAHDLQTLFIINGSGDGEQPQAHVMLVDQRYFAALRIPLLQSHV